MIGAEFGIDAFVLQAGNLMQTDQLLAGSRCSASRSDA
jgi:NitT/TauT family transport system permease protein